jgi:DNA-binding NarL/FixJ family response regulator
LALLQAWILRPDIIILKIKPPELNGIEIVSLERNFSLGSNTLCISPHTLPNIAREVMKAGASGHITKISSPEKCLRLQ